MLPSGLARNVELLTIDSNINFSDCACSDDCGNDDANYVPDAANNNNDDGDVADNDYPFDEDDNDAPDDPGHIAGVQGYYPPNDNNQQLAIDVNAPINADVDAADVPTDDNAVIDAGIIVADAADLPNHVAREPPNVAILDGNAAGDELIEAPDNKDMEAALDQQHGKQTAVYNLRQRKPRDYGHHIHATLEHTAMTQLNMKKGIKGFGDAGINAVLSELQQLHDRKVLEPRPADELTREEKRAALHSLMFLKKKRKGRECADGRKQRLQTNNEDASSPTIAIESVMLSYVMDATERRNVAIVDIPGAFMQAEMDKLVHMQLDGKMVELLVLVNPDLYQ
jgi:hypothetical protein